MSRGTACAPSPRALEVSRDAVREVLGSGTAEVPRLVRAGEGRALPRARSSSCYARCKGNLVRVHEELWPSGRRALLSRRSPPSAAATASATSPSSRPAATTSRPGEEMQHDTSPHDAQHRRRAAARCRPPRWCSATRGCSSSSSTRASRASSARSSSPTRFAYFGGACRTLHDRQHPRGRAHGHRQGHGAGAGDGGLRRALRLRPSWPTRRATPTARRASSGRFDYIENNFLAGRDVRRLGRPQPRRRAPGATRSTPRYKQQLHASRRELFAAEQPAPQAAAALGPRGLRAAPAHRRRRGLRHTCTRNRYSVPYAAHRPAARGARDQGPRRHLRRARARSPRTTASARAARRCA